MKDLLKTNVQSQGHTKLRKCARNFLRYCDVNANGKITIEEWVACLKLPGKLYFYLVRHFRFQISNDRLSWNEELRE